MSGMFGTKTFIPFPFIIIILLILLSLALALALAESICVHQRESRDSRAVAFRHGAVVTLRGRPVMNRICSDSCSDVQTSRSAILLLSLSDGGLQTAACESDMSAGAVIGC